MKFSEITNLIENRKGVYILNKADDALYHFISFIYRGYRIYLQQNEGSVDENHPGEYIFTVHRILPDGCTQTQITYFEAFENFGSIDRLIDGHKFDCESNTQPLDAAKISSTTADKIARIIRKEKGIREQGILQSEHFCVPTDIWNDNHKVVNVLRLYPEEDGYFDGFQVDLVRQDICV